MRWGRVGRKHWVVLSMSLFVLLLAAPFALLRFNSNTGTQLAHSRQPQASTVKQVAATVPDLTVAPRTKMGRAGQSTALVASPKQGEQEQEQEQEQQQQQQQQQQQCRRQVPAVVAVADSGKPLTFAFPASSRYRTACYQPTTQVLTDLGWVHDPDAGRQATLVSRVPDPAKALTSATGAASLPYRRGHAYIDRLPNYTLIGGSKYEQWHVKEQWLAKRWQTGGSLGFGGNTGCEVAALATPLFPEQYVLTDPVQCVEFFQRYMYYRRSRKQRNQPGQWHAPRVWFLKQASGAYRYLHAAKGIEIFINRPENLTSLWHRFGSTYCPRAANTNSGIGSEATSTPVESSRVSQAREEFLIQAEVPPLLLPATPIISARDAAAAVAKTTAAPKLASAVGNLTSVTADRKWDFRAFMLVGRASPLYAFSYRSGFLRIASAPYPTTVTENTKTSGSEPSFGDAGEAEALVNWASQITNAEFGFGMSSMEFDDHYWSFEQLQHYLSAAYAQGRLNLPSQNTSAGGAEAIDDWVETVLRPYVKHSMVLSLLAADGQMGGSHRRNNAQAGDDEKFPRSSTGEALSDWHNGIGSGTYQLFAFDFMVSASLDIRMLEANGRPALCSLNDNDSRTNRTTDPNQRGDRQPEDGKRRRAQQQEQAADSATGHAGAERDRPADPGDKQRCRTVPCAQWLVDETRRMEEDKHAIVRALHEYGPVASAASTGRSGGRRRGVDLGMFVEGDRYPKPSWPRELWKRASSDEDTAQQQEEGGFELIYSEQQRRCDGRLQRHLADESGELEQTNPCVQLRPFT